MVLSLSTTVLLWRVAALVVPEVYTLLVVVWLKIQELVALVGLVALRSVCLLQLPLTILERLAVAAVVAAAAGQVLVLPTLTNPLFRQAPAAAAVVPAKQTALAGLGEHLLFQMNQLRLGWLVLRERQLLRLRPPIDLQPPLDPVVVPQGVELGVLAATGGALARLGAHQARQVRTKQTPKLAVQVAQAVALYLATATLLISQQEHA
jgi:hypothetical protein